MRVFLGLVALEALSFLVVFHPVVNGVVALLLALVLFMVTLRRPEWGLLALGAELVIGSKGGLFRFHGDAQNNGGISIRILFFLAFFAAWLIWSIRQKTWREWKTYVKGREAYGVLFLLLVYTFVRGRLLHQSFVFADANAWGLWALLLPVVDIISHRGEQIRGYVWPVLKAALLWVSLKTLILFYYFSHAFSPIGLEATYLWVRRTGVGEITRASGTAFRIFFQSHIYALGAVLVLWLRRATGRALMRSEFVLLVLSLAEILVSLSRSFWIGMGVGTILLGVWIIWRARPQLVATVRLMALSGVAAIGLAALLLWFPMPPSDASLTSLLNTRVDASDDAAMSRWKLLPMLEQGIARHPILGSGFGATITYVSLDPRIVQTTGGQVTTYAFEWGWLDIWYKFGVFGIPVVLLILFQLAKRIKQSTGPVWVYPATVMGFLMLIAVHMFTPYLNHPLGFGMLLSLEGYLALKKG